MSFLDEVWKTLEARKTGLRVNPDITFPEEMRGYRTIPIQSLQRVPSKRSYFRTGGSEIMSNYGQKKIIYFKQNAPLSYPSESGFFTCFYDAYMAHGDIKVKPDEVWLVILIWFARYVNDNAEQLRKAFVTHEGKKKLSVMIQCQGDYIDWDTFFKVMIQRIKENTVGKVTDKLVCNFSSTSDFDRVFSTAAIMAGFKKYFDYQAEGAGCGIVRAHMAGTLEDWEGLVAKLEGLAEYDVDGQLKRYVRGLRPVLEQFVETYKGYAHLEFWNNIYHERKDPTIPSYTVSKVINGWLIKFFTSEDSIIDRPNIEPLSVDIAFKNLSTMEEKKLTLLCAMQGYSVENEFIYRPQFAYGIVENKPKQNLFVIRRPNELSEEQKRKREKEFQLPNRAQIAEMRKEKSRAAIQRLPPVKARFANIKLVYGTAEKRLGAKETKRMES